MNSEALREKFRYFPIPERLGNLASELARISNNLNSSSFEVAATALRFSQGFIEWVAPDLLEDRFDDAARLVEIQRALTLWSSRWTRVQDDPFECAGLVRQARQWSDEVLKMSGLLDQE